MKKSLKTAALFIVSGILLLCLAAAAGCAGRDGSGVYVEKQDVYGGTEVQETVISLADFEADGSDGVFGLCIDCGEKALAQITVKTFKLEDADYKDTGDVICYTGKETREGGVFSEQLEIPNERYEFRISGAAKQDGITRKIALTLKNKTTGTETATFLLTRDGQILLSSASVEFIANELTSEEAASLLVGNYTTAPVGGEAGATSPIPRLGVPALSLADGPQGVRLATNTVWYPCGALMASSWDRQNIYNVGVSLGRDCDANGVDVLLGPGMNVQRVVLGGRNFEYFSEDPYLTGIAAAAYTSGLRSRGIGVAAKHYAVNNQESSRGSVSAEVNERALREIYLRGFGYLVRKADPFTIMSSYNRVNGVYSSINKPLLSVLRDEFGFSGFIMSDWGSAGAVGDKVNAGNDLTEPGNADQYNELLSAINNGTVTAENCRKACENILRVAAKSRAYEKMLGGKERITGGYDFEESREAALAAAESGMVLLKNEGNALPIKENSQLALIGIGAYNPIYGGGGSGTVFTGATKDLIAGLMDAGYIYQTKAAMWFGYSNKLRKEFDQEAPMWAVTCEAAVIVIKRQATEGEDQSPLEGGFLLNEDEKTMIQRTSEIFRAAGKKVVVIINSGNPIETASWRDQADAILWIGYPGETLGTAVANIISGKTSPSGKLTCTWPETYESTPYSYDFPGSSKVTRYRDDVYVGYRFYEEFEVKTAFCFGHGLSYTTFEYSDFKVKTNADGTFDLTVTVKNTGDESGREVVQFYVTKPETEGLLHLKKELCGFDKTPLLKPGESAQVKATVTGYELESFFDEDSAWKVASGEYAFSVGASSQDIKFTEKVSVMETGEPRKPAEKLRTGAPVDVIAPGQIAPLDETAANLAARKDTYCSGVEGDYSSAKAVDGDKITRWSAAGTSGERWLAVDLGEVKNVDRITVLWESNTAYSYTVEISADEPQDKGNPGTKKLPSGIEWTTVSEVKSEDWDLDVVKIGANARFVRIRIPESAGWCSIYELCVYGGN